VTAAVLRATTESGLVLDDPTEDGLWVLFEKLEAGEGSFLVVESLLDPHGQTFAQAVRSEDGSYVVEYRQGSADQHFQTSAPDYREAHALVTLWAFGRPGLLERAVWHRLEP
jgi:hypothetical protein